MIRISEIFSGRLGLSTTTIAMHHFKSSFSGQPWLASSALVFFLHLFWKETFVDKWHTRTRSSFGDIRCCGTAPMEYRYRLIYDRWPAATEYRLKAHLGYFGSKNHGAMWLFIFALYKYSYLCTHLLTYNLLGAGCLCCYPTNSIKALKETQRRTPYWP